MGNAGWACVTRSAKQITDNSATKASLLEKLATTGARFKNDNEPNKEESLAPNSRDSLRTLFREIPNTLRISQMFPTNDDKKFDMVKTVKFCPRAC